MGSRPPGESAGHQANDAQQLLTEEIETIRERLGAAAEQLAARVDLKSRARTQVTDLAGRARSAGAKAGRQAAARAGSTAGLLGEKTTASARRKATAATQAEKGQPGSGAEKAPQAVPGSARQAISKAAGVARDKRTLCSVAAGAALAVALLVIFIWQRSKR